LCAIILDSEKLSEPSSSVREKLIDHSKIWQQLEIPKDCFSLIGIELVDLVSPIFAESFSPSEAERMEVALGFVFKEAQKFIIQPLLNQENMFNEARRFYEDVAKELNWTSQVFEDRLFEVNRELSMSGTYTQTSKEIEIGARLCWRNSAKCIGRIAWNTLEVRDRRHCTNPNDMIKEIIEHLKLATGGTNIQSVMTVFRPQFRNELWGLRFWSSQFVRYAGYIDEKTGEILGDPANAKFTSFLIDSDLWSPPYTKTAFDILPIVIKLPNNDTPFVVDLPKTYCHEVMIEHPKFPNVKELNLKWAAVPTISNFVMRIGVRFEILIFDH
jgi:nitric oxide synthase oxygenase domain/subunit